MRIDRLLNVENVGTEPTNPNFQKMCSNNDVPAHHWHQNQQKIGQNEINQRISSFLSPNSSADALQAYSSYHQSYREHTASTRSSYSGPSINPSSAATSPLEASLPLSHDINGRNIHYDESAAMTQYLVRDNSHPRRVLPPLTSFMVGVNNSAAPRNDGAISPCSTVFPQSQQSSQQGGFFLPSGQALHQQYYTQAQNNPRSNSSTSIGNSNTCMLMGLADVAVGGRRGSEEVIPGGDLPSSRRGSMDDSRTTGIQSNEYSYSRINSSRIEIAQTIDPSITSTQESSDLENPLFRGSAEPISPRTTTPTDAISAAQTSGTSFRIEGNQSVYEYLNQPPKCSYCAVCTTGSPLRKVVSHIFGRNKLSTRQIPKNVWVYYCRKHYQRSRYRNPRGFARQQVLLVRRQCERLEQWGGVKDWVIKVRRREELRMNREVDNVEEVEEIEDENEDDLGVGEDLDALEHSSRHLTTAHNRRRSSADTGSNWIMKHTGCEKTIKEVYCLLERIEVEVQQNGGKFPDVELLPNVDLTLALALDPQPDTQNEEGHHSSSKASKRLRQNQAEQTNVELTEPTNKKQKNEGSGKTSEDNMKGKASEHDIGIIAKSFGLGGNDWQNAAYDTSLVKKMQSIPSPSLEIPLCGDRHPSSWGMAVKIGDCPAMMISAASCQPSVERYVTAPRRSTRACHSPRNQHLYNSGMPHSSPSGSGFTPRQPYAIPAYEENFEHRNGNRRPKADDLIEFIPVANYA